MTHTLDKSSAYQQGIVIFAYLAVLTALEYFVAVMLGFAQIMIVIALVKAALVMYYYMHITNSTPKTKAMKILMSTKPARIDSACGSSCFPIPLSLADCSSRASTCLA